MQLRHALTDVVLPTPGRHSNDDIQFIPEVIFLSARYTRHILHCIVTGGFATRRWLAGCAGSPVVLLAGMRACCESCR